MANGDQILYTSRGSRTIQVIDGATGSPLRSFAFNQFVDAFTVLGNQLWVALEGSNRLEALAFDSGLTVTVINVAPGVIDLISDGNRLWVVTAEGVIRPISLVNFELGEPFTLPVPLRGAYYDGLWLWLARADNALQPFNPRTGVFGTPFATGNAPTAFAFENSKLWIANRDDNTVQAIRRP
jgi:DNA-binding beta-propeller fold protein YncE